MRLLVCAGGTGGGIYPALAVIYELREMGIEEDDILWIGTKGEMEETLVRRAGIRLETISGGPIVGVPLSTQVRNAARLATSVSSVNGLMREFQPDVMLMTGGYVAAPASLAARVRRLPLVIYLPDVEPGSSVRFALPGAEAIACTTAGSSAFVPEDKMVVTGYPVRADIRAATAMTQAEARRQFELSPDLPTLFVFGGSRGARNINHALMDVLPELLAEMQVIHISGTLTWPEVEASAGGLAAAQRERYRPFPYLHDRMGAAFRAADLVVARAGASMLGEGPAFGLPAVLVPLTFAWRYQKVNADFLTDRGAAVQLTDESLADELLPIVRRLMFDEITRQQMSAAARALDKPDAAVHLAELLIAIASGQWEGAAVAAGE